MTQDQEETLGRLLRDDAPPERDALFRFGVFERRERQRFQRRSLALLAAAAGFAVIFWLGFNAGAGLLVTAVIAVFCAAFAVSYVLSMRGVAQLLRRLRSGRRTAEKN
jgi:hypothetical protein